MDSSEVVRLSFGPLANATSAHLCNLETSAIVNDVSSNETTILNPRVTHRSVCEHTLLVPRTVFVDHASSSHEIYQYQYHEVDDDHNAVVSWDGGLDRIDYQHRHKLRLDYFDVDGSDGDNSDAGEEEEERQRQAKLFDNFHQCAANRLAASFHRNSYLKQVQASVKSCSKLSNGESRHVDWGDDDDDELENDEDVQWRGQLEEREEMLKIESLNGASFQAWKSCPKPQHWRDYLTLPRCSAVDDMILRLPTILASNNEDTMSSYLAGWKLEESSLGGRNFREDVLSESLRSTLEESDRVGGFQLLVDFSGGFHAGLATSLLEEIGDECKSAGRWCITCDKQNSKTTTSTRLLSRSSQDQRRKQFRCNVNKPLSMHGLIENSDLLLPLDLSACIDNSSCLQNSVDPSGWGDTFLGSGIAALLLDTSAVSYRLNSSHKGQIATAGSGMNFYTQDFISRQSYSFQDFVSSLLPSRAYGVIQMSGILSMTEKDFNNNLCDGTSIMYERLMRSNSRLRRQFSKNNLGKWLSCENMVTTLHSLDTPLIDRSRHSHFALSSSIRCINANLNESVTCQLESMNKFRPDRSTACSVNYSLDRTIQNETYWRDDILSTFGFQQGEQTEGKPITSLLENSTLCHSFIRNQTETLKHSLSRSMKGFYTRDETEGLLLDFDESMEAAEVLLTLDDNYDPGFDENDDGPDTYYDDGNED